MEEDRAEWVRIPFECLLNSIHVLVRRGNTTDAVVLFLPRRRIGFECLIPFLFSLSEDDRYRDWMK